MATEILEDLEDKQLVKIFWTDSTGEERVKKGYVLKIGSDFLKFQTNFNDYFVARGAITSIQIVEERKG